MRILAVTNMYPTTRNPSSGVFVEQQIKSLRELGLLVDVMFVDRLRMGKRAYFGLATRIRQALTTRQYDVVHSMYGGVMADQVVRGAAAVPTVITFHGSDLLGENLSGPFRKLVSHYGVMCSRRASRQASGIIVVAKRLMEALPAGATVSRARVVPCGIDLTRFSPLSRSACLEELRWDPQRFHILFSGSPDAVKRPALARAAAEQVNGWGIQAEIHYLRGIANDRVPIWLNGSHVVLITSLHEGSPTIVKEALACNVPIVSVDVGDVAERINGIEGCHIALPEPQDIARKLRLVHRGPRRISGRAKMQEVSLARIAEIVRQIYVHVSDARSAGRFEVPCLRSPAAEKHADV